MWDDIKFALQIGVALFAAVFLMMMAIGTSIFIVNKVFGPQICESVTKKG